MCGLPGAGKSTWVGANRHDDEHVMSAEIIRRVGRRKRMPNQILGMQLTAGDYLRRGIDVLIDACATNPNDRHEWLFIARRANATTRLVVIETPTQICIDRQVERGRQGVPIVNIRKQAAFFEFSQGTFDDEGWEEIVRVSGAA